MAEWWYAVVDGSTRLQARRTALTMLMVKWVGTPEGTFGTWSRRPSGDLRHLERVGNRHA